LFQIWVYGNSFEYFLVAVINPNKQALEAWAGKNDMKMEFDSLCEDSRTKSYILGELVKIAKEKKVLFSFKSHNISLICYTVYNVFLTC
jgi:long-chain acyl-CoA synthetase